MADIPAGFTRVEIPEGFTRVAGDAAPKPPEKYGPARDPQPSSLASDIAALPGRAGRLMIGKDKPEGLDDYALMAAPTAAAIYATGRLGGAVPGAPAWLPAVARSLAAGGLGKARGESNWTAAMEAAGAGMLEGTGSLIGKLGGKAAEGLERVGSIIGRGKDGPTNVKGLLEKVQNWMGASTKAERDALLHGLDAGTAPKGTAIEGIIPYLEKLDPRAAKIFAEEVAQGWRLPKGMHAPAIRATAPKSMFPSLTSETIRDTASSDALRSIADSVVSENRTAAGMASEYPISKAMDWVSTPSRLLHMLGR